MLRKSNNARRKKGQPDVPPGYCNRRLDLTATLQRLQTLEATVGTLEATVTRLQAENAELRETVAKQKAVIRK